MSIEVIPCLKVWEVIEKISNGERWVVMALGGNWVEQHYHDIKSVCKFIAAGKEVAIINDGASTIWCKFNFNFFNQYGGLPTSDGFIRNFHDVHDDETTFLVESPYYYWTGGESPVPEDVLIEAIDIESFPTRSKAKNFNWENEGSVVAFKILGE